MVTNLLEPINWLTTKSQTLNAADGDNSPGDRGQPVPISGNPVAGCACCQTFNGIVTDQDYCPWIRQKTKIVETANKKKIVKIVPDGPPGYSWYADISLDMKAGIVIITVKLQAINETNTYNGGNKNINVRKLKYIDVNANLPFVAGEIKKVWSNKFKIKVKFKNEKCPEKTFQIQIDPVFVSSDAHCIVHFYNIPRNSGYDGYKHRNSVSRTANSGFTLTRSFTDPYTRHAYWNLGDKNSVTQFDKKGRPRGNSNLEPHEFGHNLGLLDLYAQDDRVGARNYYIGNQGTNSDLPFPNLQVYEDLPPDPNRSHIGLMGSMTDRNVLFRGYALPVTYAIIKRLNNDWGMPVEAWEIII